MARQWFGLQNPSPELVGILEKYGARRLSEREMDTINACIGHEDRREWSGEWDDERGVVLDELEDLFDRRSPRMKARGKEALSPHRQQWEQRKEEISSRQVVLSS